MYRRILIAVDPDGLSADAAPAVVAVAGPDPKVQIVLVRDLSQPRARRDAAEEAFERLFDAVRARHLSCRLERRDAPAGRVAEELAQSALAFGADLIVLGSHRHGDLYALLRGSVGHQLAARVSTPILIVGTGVTPPDAEVRRVLVAVDGGEPSRQAVAAVGALAKPETEVAVLHVDTRPGGQDAYPPYDEALARLRAAGLRVRGQRVSSLHVGSTIARLGEAMDADLIVVGSRRLGRLQALLLGSVAHQVVAHTRRTLLLAAGGTATLTRPVTQPATLRQGSEPSPAS